MKNEFVPYDIALAMKELGFTEKVLGHYWLKDDDENDEFKQYFKGYIALSTPEDWNTDKADYICSAPLYQQALNFLYSASDGKINISINGKETNEERNKKFRQAIEDLWNLQNNKPY